MADAPVVLLLTTNGAGMGHLARQTAVGQSAVGFTPVLASMSVGLATVLPATGMRGEYIPGYQRGWVPRARWDSYLAARLGLLVDAVGAEAVVFDGVAPYRGLTAWARARRDLPLIWFRRGLWRSGANERALRAARYFDRVIEPGDLAAAADAGATARRSDSERIAPVTLLSTTPALPRAEAAAALGLDPDRPTLLITLGAGNLNDTAAPMAAAVQAALAAPGDWQVAVTSAPIAEGGPHPSTARVTVLRRVFPLVRYRAAFDAVVAAAGYNAVHEFVLGGTPTLLVPNPSAATDDQVGRARQVALDGRALAAPEDQPQAIAAATTELLLPATRERLSARAALLPIDGAATAADLIASTLGAPAVRRPAVDPGALRGEVLGAARQVLGDSRYSALATRLGRPQLDLTPRRVQVVDQPDAATHDGVLPLLLTPDLAPLSSAPTPVIEHLGVDDAGYRAARLDLIRRSYDVQGGW